MRIETLNIQAFGQFTELELTDLGHPLVVFRGPNEAGKSTLFEFLKTMLYGIYPTNADQHPYAPWSGRRIEGGLKFTTAAGQEFTVSRRLLSSPDGKLVGEKVESLRNQTIPVASHVSRDLFDAVYALSLADMAALEDRPWDEVQERLLGTVGLEIFRPVRSVISDLNGEAGTLWRETARGNQVVRQLELDLRELARQVREATERDKLIRELDREMREFEEELNRLEDDQRGLKNRQRQIQEILPVRNLRRRLEASIELAGDSDELSDIPPDPETVLRNLEGEINEAIEDKARLQKRIEEFQQADDECSSEDRVLGGLTVEFERWDRTLINLEQRKSDLEDAVDELTHLENELEQGGRDLLTVPLDQRIGELLDQLSIPELKASTQRFEHAEDQVKEAEQTVRNMAAESPLRFLIPSIVVGAVGVLLAALSISFPSLLVVGLAMVVIGGVSTAILWPLWRKGVVEIETVLTTAQTELESSRQDLDRILADLPLPQARIARPDAYLVNDLTDLQRSLRVVETRQSDVHTLRARIGEVEAEYSEWVQELGQTLSNVSAGEFHRALKTEYLAALERIARADTAASRVVELRDELAALQQRVEQKEGLRAKLRSRLEMLGKGDLSAGLTQMMIRREAHQEARRLAKALDQDHPQWEALEEEIQQLQAAGQLPDVSLGEKAEIDDQLDRIGERMRELSGRIGENQARSRALQEQPSASDIESEMENLRAEKEEASRQRDRLALLSSIIQHADGLFREKHQPDVLKRASHFLATILDNKYTGIGFDDETNRLYVLKKDRSHPITVGEPLSRGTLDQIYLALRLALVEHLDANSDALPIFLDEILVNWDRSRRARGYALLQEISRNRQILFFTCHDWLKNELAEQLGAKPIELN